MHNGEVLKDLKFGIGDGNLQVCSNNACASVGIAVAFVSDAVNFNFLILLLTPPLRQYYLYNYAHPEIKPVDVGLVML